MVYMFLCPVCKVCGLVWNGRPFVFPCLKPGCRGVVWIKEDLNLAISLNDYLRGPPKDVEHGIKTAVEDLTAEIEATGRQAGLSRSSKREAGNA